jgi:hypothetical protein
MKNRIKQLENNCTANDHQIDDDINENVTSDWNYCCDSYYITATTATIIIMYTIFILLCDIKG